MDTNLGTVGGQTGTYQAVAPGQNEALEEMMQEEALFDEAVDQQEKIDDAIEMLAVAKDSGDKDAIQDAKETLKEVKADAKEVAEIDAALEKLNQELNDLIEQTNNMIDQLEIAEKNLKEEERFLDEAREDYNKTKEEYDKKSDEYNAISKKLENATQKVQDDQKAAQESAINKAKAEYNEEEDGDWDTYLNNYLSNVSLDEGSTGSLQGQQAELGIELDGLKIKMGSKLNLVNTAENAVKTIKAEVSSLKQTIETNQTSIDSKRTEIVEKIMSTISCEEMALVEENGIDLKEKHPDGSPKYVFAKGKEDGKYHIYEMDESGTNGTTLARTYAEGGGFDIIKSGNGYLHGMTKTGECESSCPETEKVYYFGDCGTACSYDATYTTCSPLSFDLNGDGVKTSNEIIDYDIDGDGVVDKINDSADAVLCFDKDGDGISGEDGSECFGNNTDIDGDGQKDGYKDGFEALKALATEAGVINGADDMVIDENDIKLLESEYGLKIKAGGYNSEAQSLLDVGITEINLAQTSETTLEDDFDGNGNQLMRQEGATFKVNGEEREYADIWHKKQNEGNINSSSSASVSNSTNQSSLSFDVSSDFGDIKGLLDSNRELKRKPIKQNSAKTAADLDRRFVFKPNSSKTESVNEEKEIEEEKKLQKEDE